MTVYEIITNQIIEKMEQGQIPWVKPWKTSRSFEGMSQMFPAYSYSTGKRYDLINQMLIGFKAGEYATFLQIKKAGGTVKKGEEASIVCGWIVEDRNKTDRDGNPILDENGKPETEKAFSLRYYKVFNILTQCENIKPKHNWEECKTDETDETPVTNDKAEAIISRYINSTDAPKYEVKESNQAYYSPAEDKVVVPMMKQFKVNDEFYSTAFHELTHSTMKESRCNRKQEKRVAFGSEEYSKEELVAEIGSCFLTSLSGLSTENSFRNSVAYLQNWLSVLKNDPKMIIQASAQAEKATEYILNA